MKTKFSFESNILLAIIFIITAVGSTGYFAYKSMTDIINAVRKEARPDEKLILLKEIILDISEAESSVKTYTITNNKIYLGPFYQSALHIQYKFEHLKELSKNERRQKFVVDSLNRLVETKFAVLKEMNILQENRQGKYVYGQANIEKQLALTRRDKEVMDQIRTLLKKIEDFESDIILRKSADAEKKADQANSFIIVIITSISILLLVLAFLIMRYIKKGRHYNSELRKAKIEVEKMALAKEAFFTRMSHEIRTPIHAMLGFTQQLLKSAPGTEQKQQIGIIKKSAEHLLTIANEILDLSKLEAGKMTIEEISFIPKELITDVFLMLQQEAESKHLKYTLLIDENLPHVLKGDPLRLKQILLNILSNALKFTQKGEVQLEVLSSRGDEKSICLTIKIKDTGIGIANNRLNEIFNEFEQAETHTSRKFGGTGLGLSISKKLCELLNGSIEIESEEGRGTLVILSIPYSIGEIIPDGKNEDLALEFEKLKNKSILIADDNEYNRQLLKVILKNSGIQYDEAVDGKMVIELHEKNDYDLILMDLVMPELGGIKATEMIRHMQNKKKSKVPVILLTAAASEEMMGKAKAAGITDFLNKPFKENDLYKLLINIFEKASVNTKKKDPEISFNGEKARDRYNLNPLLRMSGNDKVFVSEMTEIFIRTTQEGIKEIKNAVASKNWDTVADVAHRIASPARHIEAGDLLKLIKQIEDDSRDARNTENISECVARLEQEAQELISLMEKEIALINK
ncbi:MAG: ATP-binding protein [Bacteroidota bacterium]|nr:ATP-binding protein [Bacteroidota bacterium]